MHHSGVQSAFREALAASGVGKKASVHTLRHSWARHLLEAGINFRPLQVALGHSSPSTAALCTHLTASATQAALATVNRVFDQTV
jgi:site-specific recombinase XerD